MSRGRKGFWFLLQRVALTIALLTAGCESGLAQFAGEPEDDTQLWPDVQVSINLNRLWNVFLFGTMRLGRNWSAITNEQLGFGATRRIGNSFSSTLSYRRLHSEAVPGRLVDEDRVFADATPRFRLGPKVTLVDRNRFEWRRVNGTIMYRYRNRMQFERPVDLRERRLVPYAAVETFYDTRFRAWSRHQIYSGARMPMTSNLTLDLFYMHQWDKRVRPGYIDVIGMLWRVEF